MLLVVRVVGLRSWEYVFADDGLFLHFSGGLMVAFDSACLQLFSQDCAALNLYLEKVNEVDGEDGPHTIVGEPFAGLHPNDKKSFLWPGEVVFCDLRSFPKNKERSPKI